MIDFVLDDASSESREGEGLWALRRVKILYFNFFKPINITFRSWDTETSFIVTLHLISMFDNFRINHRDSAIFFIIISVT